MLAHQSPSELGRLRPLRGEIVERTPKPATPIRDGRGAID